MSATRERALAAARLWIGTPYRPQASVRGAGADCLGLVRGIWREVCGAEPEVPPPYSPDWAERARAGDRRAEPLLSAAQRWLVPVPAADAQAGDVAVFRYAPGRVAKHCAVLTATPEDIGARMIHAYAGRAVCEAALTPWWRRRLAGVFAFPERSGR